MKTGLLVSEERLFERNYGQMMDAECRVITIAQPTVTLYAYVSLKETTSYHPPLAQVIQKAYQSNNLKLYTFVSQKGEENTCT